MIYADASRDQAGGALASAAVLPASRPPSLMPLRRAPRRPDLASAVRVRVPWPHERSGVSAPCAHHAGCRGCWGGWPSEIREGGREAGRTFAEPSTTASAAREQLTPYPVLKRIDARQTKRQRCRDFLHSQSSWDKFCQPIEKACRSCDLQAFVSIAAWNQARSGLPSLSGRF